MRVNIDSVAERLHRALVKGGRAERLSALIADFLPDGALTGIDVGCGTAEIATLVEARRSGTRIVGAETFDRRRTSIPVAIFDGRVLPFPDNAFDFGLLIDVLHHATDPRRLLSETIRVTRWGVVLKDHLCESSLDRVCLRFMDWIGNASSPSRRATRYLSAREWEELFRACELSLKRERRVRLYVAPLTCVFDRHLHFMAHVAHHEKRGLVSSR